MPNTYAQQLGRKKAMQVGQSLNLPGSGRKRRVNWSAQDRARHCGKLVAFRELSLCLFESHSAVAAGAVIVCGSLVTRALCGPILGWKFLRSLLKLNRRLLSWD